ncbi:MAG: acyl carrier protein [Myxococcota bacterium]
MRRAPQNDFQVPPERIALAAHLRTDLGLDSLALTDLAFLVKQDFALDGVSPESFRGVTTVEALVGFVVRHAA